ncbi:hypothetical protein ACSBR1_020979 [Camellia fascicularis]
MNPMKSFDIFKKFRVVRDVYIPQKRRKVRNTRFAFVRFDCAVAAEVVVQKANGIWVEDKKLEVKHTDYEVTKNTSNMGGGIVIIKAEEIGNGWLYDSVVVCLKPEYANIKLKEEI